MKFIKEYAGLVALVIFAIMSISSLLTNMGVNLGAAINCQSVTCFTTVGVLTSFQDDGTFKLGASGTALTGIVQGTCTLTTTAGNLPLATSTKPFDCVATGVLVGDTNVQVTLPSDGGSLGGIGGIQLMYAKASTTAAGHIEVGLANYAMQVATTSFPSATTSVPFLVVR